MSPIFNYISLFYFVGILFSILGLPISNRIFSKFPDKGYALSRTIGILFFSYICWILSYALKIHINFLSVWIILFILITAVYFLARKTVLENLKSNYKNILLEEAIFLIFFIGLLLYRFANPKIEGIEKFMDFAIINNLHRAETLPPIDTWYSGHTINYYYFGQYFLAMISKLTQIPTSISYNLDVPLIFALSAINIFSVSWALIKNKYFALFNSFVLVLAGNLDLLFTNSDNYFYANARSLIEYTINEFPSYSFMISDLHAHILDIPFVLLFIGVLVNFFLHKEITNKLALALAAVNLGAMAVTNSWDFLIYAPALIVVFAIKDKNIIKNLAYSLFVIASAIGLYIFFYLDFKSAVGGIGLVHDHLALMPTIRMFGFFFLCCLVFAVFQVAKRSWSREEVIIALLFVFALILAETPNVIFLKDIYFKFTPLYYRANTVFKFWYQAWIVYSLTPGFILYMIFRYFKKYKIMSSISLAAIIFLGIYIVKYPYISYKSLTAEFVGLDGKQYLNATYAGENEIIDWLNQNEKGQPVILEAAGQSYTTTSLVSSYTGLPTVLGWSDHELGWRDDWPTISNKLGEVEKLYKSDSETEVRDLINKYNIKYVLIGKNEKDKYGAEAGTRLREIAKNTKEFDGADLLTL